MDYKLISAFVLVLLVAGAASVMLTDESDADDGYDVEDGIGNKVHFDHPIDKIVTIGKGPTSIALNLGYLDSIVVCDKYSYSASEAIFGDLKKYVDEGKITAGGSTYSSGLEQLESEVVAAADPKTGSFDKETDALIITGTESAVNTLITYFKDLGFQKILGWYSAEEYDDIIGCAEAMSMVLKGSIDDSVDQMSYTVDKIADTLKSEGVEARDAFYITYSSSNWKVGNTGSLANSMILVAGGNSVTMDSTVSTSTYTANPTQIIEKYGVDTIVFIDNSIAGNAERLSELRTMVGSSVKLVPLESLWNNYSIESIKGVWTMACAMYPDYFEGDVPEVPEDDDGGNLLIYVAAGIVVIVAVVGIAVFMIRRP